MNMCPNAGEAPTGARAQLLDGLSVTTRRVWTVDYMRGMLVAYDPRTRQRKEWASPLGKSSLPYAKTVEAQDRSWWVETGKQPNWLAGFDPATITRVTGQTMAENMAALKAGTVDVIQVFEPFPSLLLAEGAGHIWHEAAHRGPTSYTCFYARRGTLTSRRDELRVKKGALRADAAAWAIIELLPAHPMISAPVAGAVTGRAKSRIYEAIEQLVQAGVLLPLSDGKRNRWWEAAGLLDLVALLESGQLPPT